MATLTCADGRVLGVVPVPVTDRHGVPYEVTLRMTLDGAPFGDVGERCGYFLAALAVRVAAARAEGSPRPAPGRRRTASRRRTCEGGLRSWARDAGEDPDEAWAAFAHYVPREHELFAFRHRDPDDLLSTGELRAGVRTERVYQPVRGAAVSELGGPPPGRWRLTRRAVVEAWGSGGQGVRAVLDSGGLERLPGRAASPRPARWGRTTTGWTTPARCDDRPD